jgi:hypothetical protein
MKKQFNTMQMGLLLMVLSLTACSNEKLPKYTVVQGLRVLALVTRASGSDQPELGFDGANFSDTLTMTPVLSDLYGAGRTLKYNLHVCLDLGIALGVTPNCENNPTKTVIGTPDDDVVFTGAATFKTPNYTGTTDALSIDLSTMSAAAKAVIATKFATASSYQKFNGLSLIVYYEVYPVGDPSLIVKSFKRIVFSSAAKAVKNSNPSTLGILDENGNAISSLPSVETKMKAGFGVGDDESYSVMDEDGNLTTKTERLETTWFLTGPSDLTTSKDKELTTDGLFLLSRTLVGELNTFYAPQVSLPTGRGRVFIGVGRDDRGGTVVTRFATGLD